MSWTGALPYFTEKELACQGSGVILLDDRFAARLPALRAECGFPLIPTSVCRTPEHNEDVGGHLRSLHLTENPVHPTDGCMAADIYWELWSKEKKLKFAQLAWCLNWSVGLHDIFIHIDRRKDIKLQQAVFVYGSWSSPFNPGMVVVE